jgi:shikimate dehydrogenase
LALIHKSAPVPPVRFVDVRFAHEQAYRKRLTPCLRVARSAGAGCIAEGVGVSVEQAAEALAWRRGARHATAPLDRA